MIQAATPLSVGHRSVIKETGRIAMEAISITIIAPLLKS